MEMKVGRVFYGYFFWSAIGMRWSCDEYLSGCTIISTIIFVHEFLSAQCENGGKF